MGSFMPLVFSIFGGMCKLATITYRRLADLLSAKRKEPYSQVVAWMRYRLNFALIQSSINALRGYRSCHGSAIRCPQSYVFVNNEYKS